MKNPKQFILTSVVVLAGLGGAIALNQAGGTLDPDPTASPGLSEPAWYSTKSLGKGITLDTVVSFLAPVAHPTSGVPSRPVSIVTSLAHGMGVLDHTVYLEYVPLDDTTPYVVGATLDRNLVVRQSPPFELLNCTVTLTPKSGFTWGTVTGTQDLDFDSTLVSQQ